MNAFTKPKTPARARRSAAASKGPAAAGATATPRSAAKAATRGRILAAAKDALEANGFEGTNIRAVAAAAEVATGTVLLHFPDKRELLHAAVFDDLAATWEATRATPSDGPLLDELVRIVTAFFDYYAARPKLSRALLRESLFAEPPWSARFAEQVADVHRYVVAATERAKKSGAIDPSLDAELLGAAFFSFYYFALLAWLQGGHPAPARLFARMLDQHLGAHTPATTKGRTR